MEYRYYILSSINDFYMADAICRELEKQGGRCYFNWRDSKKEDSVPDSYDGIKQTTSLVAIVNDEFLANNRLVSTIYFYSKKTSNDKVFVVVNGDVSEYPETWNNFMLVDAVKGLDGNLLAMIKGEVAGIPASKTNVIQQKKSTPVVTKTAAIGSQVSAQAYGEQPSGGQETAMSVQDAETLCLRVEGPAINELIRMEEGMSLSLQRAFRYLSGDGVPQDDERAYSLFKKAVKDNPTDAKAQYCFGVCSELEIGGGKLEDAAPAYENALEAGCEPARIRLGKVKCEMGKYQEARDLLSGLSSENPEVSYSLGLIDEAEGKYEDAVEHYSEAAEAGFLPAQNALGCLYVEGKGIKQDETKGLQWFVMAANAGLTEAMVNAGVRLIQYDDEEFFTTGETMLQEAANRGNEIARLQMLELEDLRMAEEKRIEMERRRQEESRRRDDDDDYSDNGGGRSAWGAFLDGLDLPGLAGYAKGRLFD